MSLAEKRQRSKLNGEYLNEGQALIYTTELTVKLFITAISFLIVEGSCAYADTSKNAVTIEKADDSAELWNKVSQLIVNCNTAQSFGNDDQIRNAAKRLWQLTDIPFGLRASAESCVSEYLDGEAIFTWASGWEFLLGDDDLKVLGTAVLNIISEHRELCLEHGDGELQVPVTAIEKVDLTGNNERDTVFHLGKVRCSESSSYFSGSAGSFVYLIVEDKVTEFLARGFAVSYALGEGNPIIILSVHGSACDGYGATNCVLATVWGDGKFEVVGRRSD